MFLASLTGPYAENQGMPVYADGLAYTGIFNVQVSVKEWPATAGLVDKTDLTPYEILEKSSRYK